MRRELCFLLLFLSLLSSAQSLLWFNITRPYERGALCNDFTPAGYFIRRNPGSDKWVIFLEGGGGCNTVARCNERFIDSRIRKDYTSINSDGSFTVDVISAWNNHSRDPLSVTSPLMTSLWRFSSRKGRNSTSWSIEGRDLLSVDRGLNPSFYDYNHVLIPYCSSDLWLSSTDFSNYTLGFSFDPLATDNQFTFRGSVIYKSVIHDLFMYHGLRRSVEVLLAGSSAGGIGAMSHTQWTLEELSSTAKLSLIVDSAWFIDFKNTIDKQFSGNIETDEENSTCSNEEDNPTLCISAPYLITNPDLFPNVPIFVVFSQYDLYILTLSLANITVGPGGIIELMRIVSEYSGSMATTRQYASLHFGNLSYYVTSCFHHVYFATSDLWGDETAILGNEAVDESYRNNRFVHKIESNTWTTFSLTSANPNNVSITISQAIQEWLSKKDHGQVVGYTESCSGPRCNPLCPEDIILGQLGPVWGSKIQLVVCLIVVAVTVLSLCVKFSFFVWYKVLQRRQRKVIETEEVDPNRGLESNLPICEDRDAISVSCLNLRYSVTLSKSALKKGSGTDAFDAQRVKRLMSVSAVVNTSSVGVGGARGRGRYGGRSGAAAADPEVPEELEEIESVGSAGNNDMLDSLREFHKRNEEKQKRTAKLKRYLSEKTIKTSKDSKKKEIIRGISAYFNPGEMIAVMGPSGCGKTTFIDLLAGRQNLGSYNGRIIVNGCPIERVRDWYVSHTGYVLQLASPYYETLTVRENLTLAAQMRLPKSYSMNNKLKRVEQILRETGLISLANTVVGASIGPGLSGGQKRRLCVALQLLSMPSLIFLDEPTSGLDSSSSLELLTHLNNIASSNRTVILTIHQPRLEIYHMFSQIILLCQGQVAYHGIPDNAYQFFVTAHLNATLNITRLKEMETKNPADMIVDMLASEESRMAILDHYKDTQESQRIQQAINDCVAGLTDSHGYMYKGSSERPSQFYQVAALETRAKKKSSFGHTIYLPAIFFMYGFLLGTVFPSTGNATFILTGFGVFSCASGLFMFPAIYNYLYQAMEIFSLEYSDGIGHTWQLVFQTFTRFLSISAAPVIIGATAAYILIIPHTQYNIFVFYQIIIFNLVLNQTWIALLIFIITAVPQYAHRVSPVLSAIAGFAGGFFIPPSQMPRWYSWLFYINPNFYGFSALMRVILPSLSLDCSYMSSLECYPTTGEYLLTYFSMDQVNPMLHVLLLLLMSAILLILSWAALFIRHANTSSFVKRIRNRKNKSFVGMSSNESQVKGDEEGQVTNKETKLDKDQGNEAPANKPRRDKEIGPRGFDRTVSSSSMLQEGQTHEVWAPGRRKSINRASFIGQNSLEMRRKSLLQRVNSICVGPPGEDSRLDRKQGKSRVPNKETLELRRMQWSLIEEKDDEGRQMSSVSSSVSGSFLGKTPSIIEEEEEEDSSSESVFLPTSDSFCRPPPPLLSKTSSVSYTMYSIQEEDSDGETKTVIGNIIAEEEEQQMEGGEENQMEEGEDKTEEEGENQEEEGKEQTEEKTEERKEVAKEDKKSKSTNVAIAGVPKEDKSGSITYVSQSISKRPLQMLVIPAASKRRSDKFVTKLDNSLSPLGSPSNESDFQASETEI